MEQRELMAHLDTALADLAGLLELWLALDDDARAGTRWRLHSRRRALQHEVAAAADGYASTLLSSAGGELSPQRIDKCRAEARGRMSSAWSNRGALAQLVERKRQPLGVFQDDLGQLALLSLEVREAVRALGDTASFDAKSAEPVENKVLVHLREATLAYLTAARAAATDSASADAARCRRAAVPELEKASKAQAGLLKLEDSGIERAEPEGAPAAALRQTVSGPLQKMLQAWGEPAAAEGAAPDDATNEREGPGGEAAETAAKDLAGEGGVPSARLSELAR